MDKEPLLGFSVFRDAEVKIRQFISDFESVHMKYLEEILIEAKENFRKNDIPLLPKTPSVKNRKRRGRAAARKSSIAPVSDDELPAKRTRTSRQAIKRESSQPISDFHKDALKNAAQISPPIATPPKKKIKEEVLTPVTAAVETITAPSAMSVTVKEEVVDEEIAAPVEASPPAKRTRATRATTRASTARTAAKQGPKTRVITKKGGRSKKKSSTEVESSQDEGLVTKQMEIKVEKAAPPPVKTKPVRASSRAATRAATATRQSARTRLVQNFTQSPAAKSPHVRPTGTPGSIRGSRFCSKLAQTPQTPSTPGANRYKDHVKRLVHLHETEIAKVHSTEEASSPKKPRLGQPPCSPKTPKGQPPAATTSPFRSSPILSLKVASKASVPKEKHVQKESFVGAIGKAVLGEKKAKEVSTFFSNLANRGVKPEPPSEAGSSQKTQPPPEKISPSPDKPDSSKEAGAPVDLPTKDVSKEDHRSDDDDDKPEPLAAANDTALSQDSLEEPPEDHDDTDSQSSKRPIPKIFSSTSSSGMEEDSLMEEKSIPSRRSVRRSSRRSSIAVSASKRRTSTYLRLHGTRQSTCSIRRSSARVSKRLSMAIQMEHDSLEPSVEPPPPEVRRSPRLQSQSDEKNTSSSSSGSSSSSCGSDDIIDKTPSPECPPSKVVRPHPKSFLNTLNANKKKKLICPGTPQSGSVITSFIQRNTPQKKTLKEQQQERKAQLLEKQKKEESLKAKLIEQRRKNISEQKRLREEKEKRVRETKAQQEMEKEEKNRKLRKREELKQSLQEKQREERKKDEQQKGRAYEKKKAEAEERRKQEMEAKLRKLKEQEEEKRRHQHLMERKREYEEQERQRRAEEQRQQQLRYKQERQRVEELLKKKEQAQALAREKEEREQRIREERERERKEQERRRLQEAEQREREKRAREEAERQRKIAAERAMREKQRKEEEAHVKMMMEKERSKQEHERLKANILKQNTSINKQHNTSALNSTFNKDKVEASPQSYELTPQRIYVAASEENYGIDDLRSDDSSDDEEAPRKKIPSWAQGAALKTAMINQYYHPPDFQALFPVIEPPDLTVMFVKKRARFNKRTSSAVWNSPIIHHLR